MSVVNEGMGDKRAGTHSFIDLDWETRVPLSKGKHEKKSAVHLDMLVSRVQRLSFPKLENCCGLVWAKKCLRVLVNERMAQLRRGILVSAAFQLCADQNDCGAYA